MSFTPHHATETAAPPVGAVAATNPLDPARSAAGQGGRCRAWLSPNQEGPPPDTERSTRLLGHRCRFHRQVEHEDGVGRVALGAAGLEALHA